MILAINRGRPSWWQILVQQVQSVQYNTVQYSQVVWCSIIHSEKTAVVESNCRMNYILGTRNRWGRDEYKWRDQKFTIVRCVGDDDGNADGNDDDSDDNDSPGTGSLDWTDPSPRYSCWYSTVQSTEYRLPYCTADMRKCVAILAIYNVVIS